jgi:hypothetical protein
MFVPTPTPPIQAENLFTSLHADIPSRPFPVRCGQEGQLPDWAGSMCRVLIGETYHAIHKFTQTDNSCGEDRCAKERNEKWISSKDAIVHFLKTY